MLGEIGAGGMGAVYRVEHTMMAKEMAMKLLRPELSGIAEVAERFEREAKSAARLDHHHIVRVTDFGKTETGALFLVMELLDGQPLTGRLQNRGKLEPNEAILLVDQILEALAHAHEHGVIHRDLKPDNVMLVEKDGHHQVKLLDFGLAKITETQLDGGKQLTTAGAVFGTPRYMSPEQASGEPTDRRADLYSAGVMLFELLSGRPPFAGASTVDVLRMHLTSPAPPLELEGVDLGQLRALDAVVQRAMAKSPKERFQDAGSFREALLACLVGADEAVIEKTHQRRAEARFASITRTGSNPTRRSNLRSRLRAVRPAVAAGAALVLAGVILAVTLSTGGPSTGDVDAALDAGDLTRVEALVQALESSASNDPRIPLYEGHLAFAKGDVKAGTEAYQRALADRDLELDPRFQANVIALLRSKPKNAQDLVETMASTGGPSTVGTLVQVFESGAGTASLRRRAYAGVVRLDAVSKLADPVAVLIEDLKKQSNRHCGVRRWYVEQLVPFDDTRVLQALQAEQNRRGNFLQRTFGGGVNRCMDGLLDTEIQKRRT